MELRQPAVWVVSVAGGFAGGTTGLAATAGAEHAGASLPGADA